VGQTAIWLAKVRMVRQSRVGYPCLIRFLFGVVARLKSDASAALAAAVIVAGSFPDLTSWTMRALGGKDGASNEAKANGRPEHGRRQERRGKCARTASGPRARGAHGDARPPPSMMKRSWR
jgi:hypothetical protein